MPRLLDIFLTMLAPIIWGSTYLVASEWIPDGDPITIAMLRALPAGLLILIILRQWPAKQQCLQIGILGLLNFTIFWTCLFISAYRLPGGVAATLGAAQPLFIIAINYTLLRHHTTIVSILAAALGLFGVALLVLTPTAHLDSIGVFAALFGAASMALGTILSKRWRGNSPLLAFTGWQLTAGGLLLLPLMVYFDTSFPAPTIKSMAGLAWLGLVGALISYALWFNGISRLHPLQVSTLGFLSPVTAILLGWWVLEQNLNALQMMGILIIFSSIFAANIPSTQQQK